MNTDTFLKLITKRKKQKNVLIFAHRGLSSLAPDNSVKALTLAFQSADVDGVEFDLQKTADGVIIVRHNLSLKTKKGQPWIRELTLKEIREYVSPTDAPTFKEVLKIAQPNKKILDIEVKSKGIVKEVIHLLKKNKLFEKTIFTTIYKEVYDEIRSIDQQVAIMYGYPRERGKDLGQQRWAQPFVKLIVQYMKYKTPRQMEEFAKTIETPFYSLYHKVISQKAVTTIHQLGKLCIGCTINLHNDTGKRASFTAMQVMIDNGVDMIKTDYPQLKQKLKMSEVKLI